MSRESVEKFGEKVQSDGAFRDKIQKAGGMGKNSAWDLVKEEGFDFTKEEWDTFLKDRQPKEGELSESDLAAVSGGTIGAFVDWVRDNNLGGGKTHYESDPSCTVGACTQGSVCANQNNP